MKIIYWNTNNIQELHQILDICDSENPDVFFLSEIDDDILIRDTKILDKTNYSHFPNPGSSRVRILIKNGIDVELGIQNKYYTNIKLPELELDVISLHLPSQMWQHFDALKEFIRDFRIDIDQNIGLPNERRILLIGDFNVSPFEKPMIDFDGFSATNSTNARESITHLGKHKSLYYNPTWKLYTNSHFPGTKHFKRPSGSSYDILEHHFLDQVVISTKLSIDLKKEEIKVIEQSPKYLYYNKGSNVILESDHLPLSYEISI
jgi:exonuclease III